MTVLKTILIVLDIITLLMFLSIVKGASWKKKDDQDTIVGFGYLIVVMAMNLSWVSIVG